MGEHEEKIEIMRKYLADMTKEIFLLRKLIMHYKHLHRGWIELQC